MAKKDEFKPNGSIVVDGIEIKTHHQEIVSCNIIEVEVGTTGHMGGDTGHGGRTYFKIHDSSCTDMRCHVKGYSKDEGRYVDVEIDDASLIELMFGGDTELDTFCEALRIGYDVLSRDAGGLDYYEPQISHKELQQINFAMYINELCEYYRKNHTLSGKGEIRKKYKVSDISVQQFFECDLHKAEGYVPQDFCNRVYAYVLDTTKAVPAPKYDNIKE